MFGFGSVLLSSSLYRFPSEHGLVVVAACCHHVVDVVKNRNLRACALVIQVDPNKITNGANALSFII